MSVVAGDWTHIYDPSVGENEQWYINDHTIFCDLSGTWHLIGITRQEPFKPFEEVDLAHATAPSLLGPWTKQPPCLTAEAAWGEKHLWAPHVIEHDGRYWMFVCGGSLEGQDKYRIHLATSDDAMTWTRHPSNPLLVDGYEARDPMVLRVEDRWVMYYTGNSNPEGGNHCVLAAFSDDLVTWSGRTVVYESAEVGDGAGPTESPFVVERDGSYLLFIGPYGFPDAVRRQRDGEKVNWVEAYCSTVVLASEDPLRFDDDGQVGHITSHAAEVIVDEDGNDWISHCGWGQGGVYLAPLDFNGPTNAPRSANPMARGPLPR